MPRIDEHTLQVRQFFVRHQGPLKAFVLSLCPNFAEADDAMQEVFLVVTRKADDERTDSYQMKQLLLRAMKQVRNEFEEKTWRAFERCVVDGQATQIVAMKLEITPATVRQYRARILRRLRQQMGEFPNTRRV